MIRDAHILVTGGAGFIAGHIIEELMQNNRITIYDNLKRNALQYSNVLKHHNVKFIQGDVLDAALLDQSMKGVDICIHAAAIAGIYSIGDSMTRTMKVNLIGIYNALEAATKHKVQRFMDFSTSEIYGPFVYRGHENGKATVGPPSEKRWIYSISKLAGEHFAHAYATDFGLKIVTVRPFNIYGPRQVGEGAIQQIIGCAIQNKPITIFNEGTQIRSWCYIDDFKHAFIAAIKSEKAEGEIFNIGNPQATTTILGLAQTIIRLTNSKSEIIFKPHPGSEVEMRVPDITKAKELLKHEPKVGLEEGLSRSIEWYKEYLV